MEHKILIASLEINTEVDGKNEQEKHAAAYLTVWLLNGSNTTQSITAFSIWFIANATSHGWFQPLMSVSSELITL